MGRRLTVEERLLREKSETQYQAEITDLAEAYGWEWRHFKDSRRQVRPGVHVGDADAAGWPDLVLVRPPECIVVEVKSEKGTTTEKQEHWLAMLAACGIEAYVSRPSTWAEIQARLTRARPRVAKV